MVVTIKKKKMAIIGLGCVILVKSGFSVSTRLTIVYKYTFKILLLKVSQKIIAKKYRKKVSQILQKKTKSIDSYTFPKCIYRE